MGHILDVYNIILLVLAVVIFLRLRSVLGRRTGSERPPIDPRATRDRIEAPAERDNVIPIPRPHANGAEPTESGEPPKPLASNSAVDRALRMIASADRSFDATHFLNGARIAYEMIVTSFAAGDRKTLKPLLSKEVFDGFVAAIQDREAREETVETTFVGIDKADFVEASLRGPLAQVTVRFVSQLVTVTRDKNGEIVDGDPNRVSELIDVWTFERTTTSNDPNWYLVATQAPE